jgi:hypothetical protein
LPEKLEKHIRHLESSSSIGVSFSRSGFIDAQSNPLGIYQIPKLTGITAEHLLCRNPIGNGSAPVIRREVFAEICFRDNRYGTIEDFYFDENFRRSEDIECWIRIVLQTKWKIEGIPEALTLYRINEEGLSADVFRQFESWEKVIEKTQGYAPELIAQWGSIAKAYQLRYLSRRAIRFQVPETAILLINLALATHWQIIIREPRRTLLTLSAAYLLKILPSSFYVLVESIALKTTGFFQQRRILKESY